MRTKKKCEDACESCGVAWYDHLGISGTCAKLELARKWIDAISTHAYADSQFKLVKICGIALAEISDNPPKAKKRSAK